MNATQRTSPRSATLGRPHRFAAACCAPTALLAASMLFATGAQAQSSGCLQFRDTLAARVDPSIRGFTLDIVPAATPLPPGAKVFGTCDGGAFKLLFRRGGNTRPTPGADSAAAPASAAQAPAPLPEKAPQPAAAVPSPAPKPAPAVVAAPPPEPAKPVAARASEVEAVRTVARVDDTPAPATTDPVPDVKAAPSSQTPGFWAEYWQWILALALLPVAAWLWAWQAHRRAYDEAGLPRGPKL